MSTKKEYIAGRGAQINPGNRFLKNEYVPEHIEGLDEPHLEDSRTRYIIDHPKAIINRVPAEDIPFDYSMNPYAGCEHGCVYCYARDTHQYLGHSPGLDFERIIYVRPNAASLLEKKLSSKNWKPSPIMLSGNTDCYQPAEKRYRITRRVLKTLLRHKHPVGIISKNQLVLRDIDLLRQLAEQSLVHVMITITTLNEGLRLQLEPRTVTGKNRLKTIRMLHKAGIPVGVMVAPVIPGLTMDELPSIIEQAAECGASTAGYTILRLNGSINQIFTNWIEKNHPDRAAKVLRHVRDCHGGEVSDSRIGKRMRGEGQMAIAIHQMFEMAKRKHMGHLPKFEFNLDGYQREVTNQLGLFD